MQKEDIHSTQEVISPINTSFTENTDRKGQFIRQQKGKYLAI